MSTAAQPETSAFEQEIQEVLGDLHGSMRALVERLPGHTRRPTDLQRTLGIDRTLAWQVHKAVHADDPLAAAQRLAGPAAMRRFLNAAEKRGAPSALVEASREAFARLEAVIERHTETRAEFETLLSGLAPEASEHVDVAQRRAAHHAQRHILGVCADADIGCYAYGPSASDPGLVDVFASRGIVRMRRFRRDAAATVATVRARSETGDPDAPVGRVEPLSGHALAGETGLVPEFCAGPLPRATKVGAPSGFVDIELSSDELGSGSSSTCVTGHVFRGAIRRETPGDRRFGVSHTAVRVPSRLLVQDSFVHRGLGLAPPDMVVLSDHRGGVPAFVGRERDRLPISLEAVFLGTGLGVMGLEESPGYEDLAGFSFERMGWDPGEFLVYRCRMEFPVLPSSVYMRFDRAD